MRDKKNEEPPPIPEAVKPNGTSMQHSEPTFGEYVRDCRAFLFFTICQAISVFLSSVCGWVLCMHALSATESVTVYTATTLAYRLPELFLSPITGWIADHWNKKRTIAISDLGALCCSLGIAIVARTAGGVRVRHILAANIVNGICSAVQTPVSMSSLPLLVPMRHRERAAVTRVVLHGAIDILTTLVGGFVASLHIALANLFWIDLSGYLVGATALFFVPIPRPKRRKKEASARVGAGKAISDLLRQVFFGAIYLWNHKGLFRLVMLSTVSRFCFGILTQILPSYMLMFSTVPVMGGALSVSSLGFLVGSAIISVFGLSKVPIQLSIVTMFLQGLILFSPANSLFAITVCGFLFLMLMPVFPGTCDFIYTTCIEPGVLGRVTAAVDAISALCWCIAIMVTGPLVDLLALPLLTFLDSLLGHTFIGTLIGNGNGRGLCFIWKLLGTIQCIGALSFIRSPTLVHLEKVALKHAKEN